MRFLVPVLILTMASFANAGMIYDIEGVFAPALKNPVSVSFVGEFEFPTGTVEDITATIDLTNEELPREINFEMALNLPGNAFQPWDFRTYAGLFEEKPVTMFLVDYDMTAGSSLDAALLEDGGGWDGWALSFTDYPVGSVSSMQQVNEPAAFALLAIGVTLGWGFLRKAQ